jgi:hypothetical protein
LKTPAWFPAVGGRRRREDLVARGQLDSDDEAGGGCIAA